MPLSALPADELIRLIKQLEKEMKSAAAQLEFEKAAVLRDQIIELRKAQEAMDKRPIWERMRQPR
jgi:excinuclease ABC subunit B